MSFYSSGQIESQIIEPSSFNSSGSSGRAEFRIHGNVLSSLKLLNVGRVGNAGAKFLDLTGALGVIRRVSIMDGRTVLTEVRNFNDWLSFNNLQKNNRHNSDMDRLLKLHRIGFQSRYFGSDTQYQRKEMIKNDRDFSFATSDDQASTNRAYFDLREAFQMLQQVPILSDKLFKQLRLVIEFETQSNAQKFQNVDNVDTSNCRPILVVDRVMDDSQAMAMLNSISTVQWEEAEHDRVQVSATTAGVEQKVSRKLLGFNGKMLGKMRIRTNFQNTASNVNANTVVGYGIYSSINGSREGFNIIINGRSLMPRGIQEGENRRLAHLVDTHGEVNLHASAHTCLHNDFDGLTVSGDATKVGKLDFFGTTIGEKVTELQVEYQRTGKTDGSTPSRYNDAMELFVEGYVSKQLQVGGGSYRVSYM